MSARPARVWAAAAEALARPSDRDRRLFELAERVARECREQRERVDELERRIVELEQR